MRPKTDSCGLVKDAYDYELRSPASARYHSMSPIFVWLFGGLIASAGLVREFEVSAARDVKAQLQGPAVVNVSTRAGLSGLWQEIGSAKIRAKNFSAESLPLFTEPERSQKGILHRLELDLTDFRLKQLRVKRLTAQIPDCRFDSALALAKKKIRLSRSGIGVGRVEVDAAALEQFVLQKFSEIKRVAITFAGDRVKVTGYGEFLVVATEFEVDARLEIRGANQLHLADAVIDFDGKRADPLSREALLKTLNPILDLERDLQLFGALQLSKVSFLGATMIAEGPATIPVRPKAVGNE